MPGGGIGRPAFAGRQARWNTTLFGKGRIFIFKLPNSFNALVAELVDALVSNTNEVTLVPVRLRPKVQLRLKTLLN